MEQLADRFDAFGPLLAAERSRRRLSQMELGLLSGVSQRHISFIERGRSRVGRQVAGRLAAALQLGYDDANRLLAAAGFRPLRAAPEWNDPQFADARRVIVLMLDKHEPFPAVVTNRSGDLLTSTKGLDDLLEFAGMADAWERTRRDGPPNLYDLALHPDGIVQLLTNPHQVVPHTMRRLAVAATEHRGAAATLERARRYPIVMEWTESVESVADAAVVIEQYVVREHSIRLIGATANLGSPEDVTAQDVRVELFFPADLETGALLHQMNELLGSLDN
jgi:transcriptional regulator with XRE-family HTH domain